MFEFLFSSRLDGLEGNRCIDMLTAIIDEIFPRNTAVRIDDVVFDGMQVYLLLLNRMAKCISENDMKQVGRRLVHEYLGRITDFYNHNLLKYWSSVDMRYRTVWMSKDEIKVCNSRESRGFPHRHWGFKPQCLWLSYNDIISSNSIIFVAKWSSANNRAAQKTFRVRHRLISL